MTDVFLSYSRTPSDEDAAFRLVRMLTDNGLRVWRDQEDLAARTGTELPREIAEAIERSTIVTILMSSRASASHWCQVEAVRACELAKPILLVQLENVDLPNELLLLRGSSVRARVALYAMTKDKWAAAIAGGFMQCGLRLRHSFASSEFDAGDSRVISPPYRILRRSSPDSLRMHFERLMKAAAKNSESGYNHLSLALMWLFEGDGPRALSEARRAVSQLPSSADAYYVEALALCLLRSPDRRSLSDAKALLRPLAIAKKQQNCGTHVDLLAALVIANVYLPHCWENFPASPISLLERIQSNCNDYSPDEICRTLDIEPLSASPTCRHLAPRVKKILGEAEAAIAREARDLQRR